MASHVVDMSPKGAPVAVEAIPEPVTAPEAPLPRGARRIRDRVVLRDRSGGGIVRWYELTPQPPQRVEIPGQGVRSLPQPDRATCFAEDNPAAEVEAMHREYQFLRTIDPRPPDELWDWLDKKIADGDRVGVEIYIASNKVKPRVPLTGLPLGTCHIGRGYLKLCQTDDQTREYLRRHATGDWGEHGRLDDVTLCDDSRWCPPAFGTSVINAVAVERGVGIVRSAFPITIEKTRGVEHIEIMTSIGDCTFITCPRRGG
jgi:hypothetical protein